MPWILWLASSVYCIAGVYEIQLEPPVNVGSCINHKQEIAMESEHKNEISANVSSLGQRVIQ